MNTLNYLQNELKKDGYNLTIEELMNVMDIEADDIDHPVNVEWFKQESQDNYVGLLEDIKEELEVFC
jgi:hypothetical protein